jgi:hypothetical protein
MLLSTVIQLCEFPCPCAALGLKGSRFRLPVFGLNPVPFSLYRGLSLLLLAQLHFPSLSVSAVNGGQVATQVLHPAVAPGQSVRVPPSSISCSRTAPPVVVRRLPWLFCRSAHPALSCLAQFLTLYLKSLGASAPLICPLLA